MIQEKVQIVKSPEKRLTADLVCAASKYKSEIKVCRENNTYNAKSLMGMFALQIHQGMDLIFEIDGEDESDAYQELRGLLA